MSEPRIPFAAAFMMVGSILINEFLPVPRWPYLDQIKRRQEKRLARLADRKGAVNA